MFPWHKNAWLLTCKIPDIHHHVETQKPHSKQKKETDVDESYSDACVPQHREDDGDDDDDDGKRGRFLGICAGVSESGQGAAEAC